MASYGSFVTLKTGGREPDGDRDARRASAAAAAAAATAARVHGRPGSPTGAKRRGGWRGARGRPRRGWNSKPLRGRGTSASSTVLASNAASGGRGDCRRCAGSGAARPPPWRQPPCSNRSTATPAAAKLVASPTHSATAGVLGGASMARSGAVAHGGVRGDGPGRSGGTLLGLRAGGGRRRISIKAPPAARGRKRTGKTCGPPFPAWRRPNSGVASRSAATSTGRASCVGEGARAAGGAGGGVRAVRPPGEGALAVRRPPSATTARGSRAPVAAGLCMVATAARGRRRRRLRRGRPTRSDGAVPSTPPVRSPRKPKVGGAPVAGVGAPWRCAAPAASTGRRALAVPTPLRQGDSEAAPSTGAGRGTAVAARVRSSASSASIQDARCRATWRSRAERSVGGIPRRASSCTSLAAMRRRHIVAASTEAASAESWARWRPPNNAGDHGTSSGTSHKTPAGAREDSATRPASTAVLRTVMAAVAPKRSASTTSAVETPTAAATSERRRCERAAHDTPATKSVVSVGRGAAPDPLSVSAATAAAEDGGKAGPSGARRSTGAARCPAGSWVGPRPARPAGGRVAGAPASDRGGEGEARRRPRPR